MKSLQKAIYNTILATPALVSALPNGVHWGFAPDLADESKAYLVIIPQPTGETEEDNSVAVLERKSFQFSVFSTSMEESDDTKDAIVDLFERSKPALESGNVLRVRKTGEHLMLDPDKTSEGEEIWQGLVFLEFQIQRSIA